MGYGRLPLDKQLASLRALLTRNPTLVEVLTRAAALALPDWYLVAGCLYQTVWNVVTGQPPESGILDYDLLLLTQNLPMTEIADRIGYSSPYAFAAAFRRQHGQPPGRWRQQQASTGFVGILTH
jgi:uncharacterized protein